MLRFALQGEKALLSKHQYKQPVAHGILQFPSWRLIIIAKHLLYLPDTLPSARDKE